MKPEIIESSGIIDKNKIIDAYEEFVRFNGYQPGCVILRKTVYHAISLELKKRSPDMEWTEPNGAIGFCFLPIPVFVVEDSQLNHSFVIPNRIP